MKKLAFLFGVLAVSLWCVSGSIRAADGDTCGLANWATSHGTVIPVWCVLLCDSATSQDSACDEFDLNTLGIPDVLVFEINTDTGCSANATATLASAPTSAGTEHDLGATTSVARNDNTKLSIDTSQVSIDRYVETDLSNMDDCTDFDVLMIGYERKR